MHVQTSHPESFCIYCADNASTTTDAISLFCKLFNYLIRDIWFPSESEQIATRLSNGAILHCQRINADIVKLELCPQAPRPVQLFEMRFRHGHWYLCEQANLVH